MKLMSGRKRGDPSTSKMETRDKLYKENLIEFIKRKKHGENGIWSCLLLFHYQNPAKLPVLHVSQNEFYIKTMDNRRMSIATTSRRVNIFLVKRSQKNKRKTA